MNPQRKLKIKKATSSEFNSNGDHIIGLITEWNKDGKSIKSIVHMPVEMKKRFRGLTLGPDGALYASVDEGEIYKITASK